MGSVAPFVRSSVDIVKGMLKVAGVRSSDVVYGLGSGDGRVMTEAVQELKARKAVGIELREDLLKRSRSEVSRLGLEGKVEIVHDYFFNIIVKPANIVTLYLTSNINEKLRPKLERELKLGGLGLSYIALIP